MEEEKPGESFFLECERLWVFWGLMLVGGFYGGYTYGIRGRVFCNAQTANLLVMAMNIGNGNFRKAAYYLIPFSAYFLGIVVSEILAKEIKRLCFARWDTILVGFEMAVVFFLGLMPPDWPDQICQVTLNFICAMQFNTFRQAEGIGMATTFCTNHLRQFASFLVRYCRGKDPSVGRKSALHGLMLLLFMLGVILATLGIRLFSYRSIWIADLILLVLFCRLLLADRTYERELLLRKPGGH